MPLDVDKAAPSANADGAGAPEIPSYDELRVENRKLRNAFKETVLNLESLTEKAERILKRAEIMLGAFPEPEPGEEE
jgi:hypothetical protein